MAVRTTMVSGLRAIQKASEQDASVPPLLKSEGILF